MSIYYFDSSALVKLYIKEKGSLRVEQITNQMMSADEKVDSITFSKIAIVETAAALARRKRERHIDETQQMLFLQKFLKDVETQFETISISETIIFDATELTQNHPLRGYDAIHLATALQLNYSLRAKGYQTITFIAADSILLQAAAAEGLHTENPNLVES